MPLEDHKPEVIHETTHRLHPAVKDEIQALRLAITNGDNRLDRAIRNLVERMDVFEAKIGAAR